MSSLRSGFSLAEVVLALLVLSAGLLAVVHAVGLAERFGAQVRARTRAVFEVREALARYQRADTVCPAPTGSRRVGTASLTWLPGPVAATRLVTVIATPPVAGAPPESAAAIVGCP